MAPTLRGRPAAPEDLVETLVTRYPPGAGIGYHRDAPRFGPTVVGVSLPSPCPMRFQRRVGEVRFRAAAERAKMAPWETGTSSGSS